MIYNGFLRFLALIFISFVANNSAFSLDATTSRLKVNGREVTCVGSHKLRFWHCEGPDFQGLLDFKPKNEEYRFLPMLYSTAKAEMNLKISEFFDEKNTDLLVGKELNFSERDYLEIDPKTIYADLMLITSSMTTHDTHYFAKIMKLLKDFFNHLNTYRDYLKTLSVTQKISCINGVFSSEFSVPDKTKMKVSEEEIPCLGQEDFTESESEFYRSLVNHSGKSVSLEEAEDLFEHISQRADIPFEYTNDGCFARSHVIANDLFKQGYKTGKIWLAGDLIDPSKPGHSWGYHVAAIIFVETDNKDTLFVIDPAPKNPRLMTLSEWLKFNNVKFVPKTVLYPIPSISKIYEEKVLCVSSHIPLWPYRCDMAEKLLESLIHAEVVNKENFELLKCRPDSLN